MKSWKRQISCVVLILFFILLGTGPSIGLAELNEDMSLPQLEVLIRHVADQQVVGGEVEVEMVDALDAESSLSVSAVASAKGAVLFTQNDFDGFMMKSIKEGEEQDSRFESGKAYKAGSFKVKLIVRAPGSAEKEYTIDVPVNERVSYLADR